MEYQKSGYVTASDGSQLFYGVYGDLNSGTPPIVCANGIGCSVYFWKYIAENFSPTTAVVVWDYRGHGLSDLPQDKQVKVTHCAEDLRAVLDALEIDRAVLAGHSMGTQVIFEAYRRFRERVAGLVPILGSYGKPLDTFFDSNLPKYIFPLVHKLAGRYPDTLSRITAAALHPGLAFIVGHRLGIINGTFANPGDMVDYFKHIAKVPVDLFFNLALDAGDHTCEDILGSISCPVLIIGGERDKFTPLWLSHEMHRKIPGSEILIIKEGSHAAIIEHPELINLRLEKFMRERVGPGLTAAAV